MVEQLGIVRGHSTDLTSCCLTSERPLILSQYKLGDSASPRAWWRIQ